MIIDPLLQLPSQAPKPSPLKPKGTVLKKTHIASANGFKPRESCMTSGPGRKEENTMDFQNPHLKQGELHEKIRLHK